MSLDWWYRFPGGMGFANILFPDDNIYREKAATMKYGYSLLLILGLAWVMPLTAAEKATVAGAECPAAASGVAVEKTDGKTGEVIDKKLAANKMSWLSQYAPQRRRSADKSSSAALRQSGGLDIAPWRMWLVLAILGGMVGGMIYIMRKYGKGILPKSNATVITVKSKVQLDARNSVSVLRIYDEEYVIGAGSGGLTLLARLLPIDGGGNEASEVTSAPETPSPRFTEEFQRAADRIIGTGVK
ncbi:MAG: flagellar biosynthetic protein FliO [Victivallales bacterium]|nr:flagellar biosynthetic protein FliO [Victivallales bacterium]